MQEDKILIDVDTILDLRIASVSVANPDWATKLIDSGKYHSRITDNFEDIVPEIKLSDKNLSWDDIKSCVYITNVVDRLMDHIDNCKAAQTSVAIDQDVVVTLNTFSLPMTDEEASMLKGVLSDALKGTKVKLCNLSPEMITPQLLNCNYTQYILYDIDKWMTANAKALSEAPMPTFEFVAPANVVGDAFINVNVAMELARKSIAPYVELTLLPLSEFSLIKS